MAGFLIYHPLMSKRVANDVAAARAALEKVLCACLLLFLCLLPTGCVHPTPLSQVDPDEPQYHPNPPILGADGKPIPPPAFYDNKGRLDENIVDPELKAWMWQVNTNMAAGHMEYEDAVGYVKGFDALLAKHKGDKSVAAEQILRAKAFFYFDAWDDAENGCRLFHQIMRDYPDTPFGRQLIKDHKGHKHPDQFDEPAQAPE